jgi:hypothetical protein
MQKKEVTRHLSLFLCFLIAFPSCNPKTPSAKGGSNLAEKSSSCVSDLTSSLENANLEHSNVDSLALLGGSASTATLAFGDNPSGFSLTDSGSDASGSYYEMITYAINPLDKANEEFYRIQLCDETSKCQCYSSLCKGDYTSCTQYTSCEVLTEEAKKEQKYWLKVTKAVDSVPTYGLSKEISLSVKYCAYNYDKEKNSALGGSQVKKTEICSPVVQSDNKAYVETLAQDKESLLAQKRLEVLASLKRKKEAQCAALVGQLGAKAAQAWFTNKKLCSNSVEKTTGEASSCVILEALANKPLEFLDLLCGEGHFDNLSLLLALNAAEKNTTSTSNNFSLVAEEEVLSQAACAEASAIRSSDNATDAGSSLTAFSDFFSNSDSLDSGYGADFSAEGGSSLEFSDYAVEEEISDANATTDIYSNEEVDNPPEFDPELAGNLEDSNALEEGLSKEQKMSIFVICAAVFGVLGLHTVVSLVKDLRSRATLSKAEFKKLTSGIGIGDELENLKKLVGDEQYKSFFGSKTDGKYSLEGEGSGFKKIKKDGLFGERIKLSAVFESKDFFKPTLVKGSDGKYYAVLNVNEDLAKKFEFDYGKAGFELDTTDGKLKQQIEATSVTPKGNGKFAFENDAFEKLNKKIDENVKNKTANFDIKAKTKINVGKAIGTGVKFGAMAGALAGMIYSASDGAFGLTSEDKSSPIKNFLDNLFSNFFVNELMPVSSEAYCYGQNMNSILEDKTAGYWSDEDFSGCVQREMTDRQEFLLDLFR